MEKDPAFGSQFFDREKISSNLIKRVHAFREGHHQNIGLLGKKFIGKSSILQNFILSTNYPDIIPMYVEVHGESFSDFAQRFMGMMLVGYYQSLGKNIPHEIEPMIKGARRELPKTTKNMSRILQLVKKNKCSEAFYELFSLCSLLATEIDKKMIIIIDEFSLFEQFDINDPFSIFGKQIMIQKNTMFIVSCSSVKYGHEIFNEKLSLLFGNFEVIEVKPFDFNTTQNVIYSMLSPINIPPNFVRFIIRLTDGQPYYLTSLLTKIKNCAINHTHESVTENMLISVLEAELFYSDGRLSRHIYSLFTTLFNNKRYYYLNVLVAIASGHKKTKEIAHFLEVRLEEAKKLLTRLLAEEIITKCGSFYYIDDPLLCFWLTHVYNLRRTSLKINKSLLNSQFKTLAKNTILEFGKESKKDIVKRVEELFMSFKNDIIEVDAKKSKYPSFSSVTSEINDDIIVMLAKAFSYKWSCSVVLHEANEDDIQELINKIKKSKIKVNKKILILPYGISINAKLLAKEAKFCLWGLRELNHLFDLYNKPKFIVEKVKKDITEEEYATT
ncbi:hypothetical protein ACFL3D_03610 [Candidatus Omnitrophota bacterium]